MPVAAIRIGGPNRVEQAVNEAATEGRVSRAIARYEREEVREEVEPEVVHHPIDPEVQTGESRKLGGAIEIRAPWRRD